MDKAQEKIKNYAAKWFDKGREYGKAPITKDMLLELEREGEELLSELGYRKLPESKPPLLSDEEIWAIKFDKGSPFLSPNLIRYRAVAQAQRDSDIKWYEGR